MWNFSTLVLEEIEEWGNTEKERVTKAYFFTLNPRAVVFFPHGHIQLHIRGNIMIDKP
jgi:hypothetical protein